MNDERPANARPDASGGGARDSFGAATDWSVDIEDKGRHGSVNYRERDGVVPMYWELGGGDTLVVIDAGDIAAWRVRHGWAADRRTEILHRVAGEVIRQIAPKSRTQIDEATGSIRIVAGPGRPAPPRAVPRESLVTRISTLKLKLGLAVLGAAAVAVAARSLFTIASPTGFPLGPSVRTPQHVATLIQALEPYVPSLHRDPADDRYRLALFLHPLDGRSTERMVPIAQQRPGGEFRLARLLGSDGRTVWFAVNGIGGVDLATGRRVGPADLRGANPSLAEAWDDPRRVSFEQRLRVTSPDRQTVLEVDPQTLKAAPVRVERAQTSLPLTAEVKDFLSSGVRPSPADWLGLHSQQEAERDYRPKARLAGSVHPVDVKEPRRFYRAALGPELDRGYREILSMQPLGSDDYLNAAFVRAGFRKEPMRLSGPDGYLMIYTAAPALTGTLMVARVDTAGRLVWKVDTGIDRFKLSQILPDERFPAFIGTRPAVPDKVPEPILVVVDTRSGASTTSTLWK